MYIKLILIGLVLFGLSSATVVLEKHNQHNNEATGIY